MSKARTIEDFLEHFGVKGMRWGVRKPRDEAYRRSFFGKAPRGDWKLRTGKQKAALVGGGYVGSVVGTNIGNFVARKLLASSNNQAAKLYGIAGGQLVGTGVGLVAGVRGTRSIIDTIGDSRVSDLPSLDTYEPNLEEYQ